MVAYANRSYVSKKGHDNYLLELFCLQLISPLSLLLMRRLTSIPMMLEDADVNVMLYTSGANGSMHVITRCLALCLARLWKVGD
jgi:hypothetical protein